MLNWANQFNIFCMLDNNGYNPQHAAFEVCLAAGTAQSLILEPGRAFDQLRSFYNERKGWIFGHLGYGLKNEIEQLPKNEKAEIDFGIGFFFEPKYVIEIKGNRLFIHTTEKNADEIFQQIIHSKPDTDQHDNIVPKIIPLLSKADYLERLYKIKQHIARGDCYEINFCQQFSADNFSPNPITLYHKLNRLSPNPFSALYKLNDSYCICASPERFLTFKNELLTSQPIKGTAPRDLLDTHKDLEFAETLLSSQKERSENVMIVDLVRNDLSKVASPGTVKVTELCGLYSFPQVHQMISTIEAILDEHTHPVEAIRACFPMASMTGAPKKRVMELIDETEPEARGLFSGAIGYFSPAGHFDFNVVIRSIFLDLSKKKLRFWAGGGITFNSDPMAEYEESMLKAAAIVKVLGGKLQTH